MKKNLLFIIIYLSVVLFIFGCAGLTDSQLKSTEAKEVTDFMNECIEAYNNKNLTKWLACFQDNSTIKFAQSGSGFIGGSFVSKQNYEKKLDDGFYETNINDFRNFKLTTIMGDRATVKCNNYSGNHTVRSTFDLVKENEKWYIIKWDWVWH
jgi:hypothetical protein